MRAMLLAAGVGSRLHKWKGDLPKTMVRVAGRPVMEWAIRRLRRHGITEIVVNLHDRPEAIRSHFGNGERFGVRLTYSPEPELLGTAGGTKKMADFFTESFLVYYADNLCDCDFTALARHHREKGCVGTIAAFWKSVDVAGGVLEVSPEGRVLRFLEGVRKERTEPLLVNAGVYVLEPRVFDFTPKGKKSDFGRDVFPRLLEAGETLSFFLHEGYVRALDTPERYRRLFEDIEKGRLKLQ